MKKTLIILGIVLLAATVALVILGLISRSMFYGIMDAPYSVYGKYGTYMKWFFISAAIAGIIGLACLVTGLILKK